MKLNLLQKSLASGLVLLMVFLTFIVNPSLILAFPQIINGQAGEAQSFADDVNVGISSAGNIHALIWRGILQPSRGGTGADLTTFANGSLLFYDGAKVSEDSTAGLIWNNSTKRLGVGTASPQANLHVVGNGTITGNLTVTGNIATNSLSAGSIAFYDGAKLTQDNPNLFWDDAGNVLRLGGKLSFIASNQVVENTTAGGHLTVLAGTGVSSGGNGGDLTVSAGSANTGATTASNGGLIEIKSGQGRAGGDGGELTIRGGTAIGGGNGGNIALVAGNGNLNAGHISLIAGQGTTAGGDIHLRPGNNAHVNLYSGISGASALLNLDNVLGNKVFTFPSESGTFSLRELHETISGIKTFTNPLNYFVAGSGNTSTVYIGSTTIPGCLALGDTDNNGITYLTVNDGVLTASATKPSTCQ
jgi:hypothetical protein